MSATEFLKNLSLGRKHPEFAEEVQELRYASEHAASMVKAGKLTKAEFADLEAHFFHKTMEALPMDLWDSMSKDGSLADLQALAGHDGTRDSADVDDVRASLVNKIKADALDEAWLDQRISAEHYARESQNLGKSDDIDGKIDKGDHDGAAAEAFASRYDVSTHDADLNAYLDKTYGENRHGREEPPQKVVRNREDVPPPKTAESEQELTQLQRELQEHMGQRRPEPAPATDANGITDIDAQFAQEAAE